MKTLAISTSGLFLVATLAFVGCAENKMTTEGASNDTPAMADDMKGGEMMSDNMKGEAMMAEPTMSGDAMTKEGN
ncbi:hypothetical protein [Neorhodopirellula pilleata]|uniref:Pentapeptide MXKDX repeat protein n=1 Tax=Neorhodopirellula pilleata TaxID=2714738 RepID=A0A5C5ZZR7_9BACT|nr:hypothetical protein [Neorhodopirellula pilleata]TWT93064.1 hypothetical protein Pla100_43800 [Neorhodopirellula pilleata]